MKYPIGIQEFDKIINGGYVYVCAGGNGKRGMYGRHSTAQEYIRSSGMSEEEIKHLLSDIFSTSLHETT